jgi:hypothetical protein
MYHVSILSYSILQLDVIYVLNISMVIIASHLNIRDPTNVMLKDNARASFHDQVQDYLFYFHTFM